MRGSDTSIADTGDENDDGIVDFRNNWALGYQPSEADADFEWGARNGELFGTLRVNQVTTSGNNSNRGRTIIGQIHAKEDEPLRLNYQHRAGFTGGCVYAASEERGGDDTTFVLVGPNVSCSSDPGNAGIALGELFSYDIVNRGEEIIVAVREGGEDGTVLRREFIDLCLLYTSPSPRDQRGSRMPSSA